MPDTSEVSTRRKDAIYTAELIFDGSLCNRCFREMSRALRSHAGKDGVTFGFYDDCDRETPDGGRCFAGADYVSITRERGGIREDRYGDVDGCACA